MDINKSLQRTGRIGILYPSKNLESVPIVYNIILMLAKSGFIVEVFIYKNDTEQAYSCFNDSNIIVHELRINRTKLLPNIAKFFRWACKKSYRKQFLCLIGVDPPGLCVATFLGILFHIPCVYLSLEIIISNDPYRQHPYYKFLELRCSRRALLIIIQDEIRANLMAEDNGIPLSRFAFLPNSPLGSATRKKSDYFQRKFGLTNSDKILLYIGTIGNFTRCKELAQATKDFPENWKLILHSRFATYSDIINCLGQFCNLDKVIISLDPVPYSMMEELVNAADIGIALYQTHSPNLFYMGKSSGKLCQYLHCGLPVIVNKMPLWEESLQRYHSGISIDSMSDIRKATENIFADYDRFSLGAINHFESELRFESAFKKILARLTY